jgi:hypothetical protein
MFDALRCYQPFSRPPPLGGLSRDSHLGPTG